MTYPLTCQEYQPEWLLPADSEVARWFEVKNTLYPSFGEPGYVMVKQVTHTSSVHGNKQNIQLQSQIVHV